jgi:hypothetical protein
MLPYWSVILEQTFKNICHRWGVNGIFSLRKGKVYA